MACHAPIVCHTATIDTFAILPTAAIRRHPRPPPPPRSKARRPLLLELGGAISREAILQDRAGPSYGLLARQGHPIGAAAASKELGPSERDLFCRLADARPRWLRAARIDGLLSLSRCAANAIWCVACRGFAGGDAEERAGN